jgi:NitT/TauT family transport system permease protein
MIPTRLIQFACLASAVFALVRWENRPVGRWGTPSSILGTLVGWTINGSLWEHVSATVGVAMFGLALGSAIGVGVGVLLYCYPRATAPLIPVLVALNAMPRILLVPIFIAWLGIGLHAKLAMVVGMTLFIYCFNTIEGLSSINPRLIANARLLGATRWAVLMHVHLPILGKWLMTATRSAIGLAFIGAVISEYFGARAGLGYLIDIAYGQNRYGEALAGLLATFLVVAMIDMVVRWIERLLFGRPESRRVNK